MRKNLFLLLAMGMLVLTTTTNAITWGTPDHDQHPQVGALVGTFTSGTYPYCSGTLISPTVFLTAAHCNIGISTVYVTFDEQFIAENSTLYPGILYTNPLFSKRQNDPHDIAVVIFEEPITHLTPAKIPMIGQFDDLNLSQKLTAVGYGGLEMLPPPFKNTVYLDARYQSQSTLNAVNPSWLRLSQNPATGDGGACYGDSGGPNFLGAGAQETNLIAGITITGDAVCRATNVIYRLDTESAHAFLSQFLPL